MTNAESMPAWLRPVPWVERMAPYVTPDDPSTIAAKAGIALDDLIKLDANENPYGPSPSVATALAAYPGFHIYPDPEQKTLRKLVGDYLGVAADRVMLGNGSDELIDLLCRIYIAPGDEVIDCTPTFGMYRFSTELCGGRWVEAPRDAAWNIDVSAVEAALTERTRLIFATTPNNPSGNLLDEKSVERLLATGRVVVLDEAYMEFADRPSLAPLVAQHDNLVVLRTFSKWAGLAGLRIGYGVLPSHMLEHLWKVKPPFNLNLAAEVAVRATLADLTHANRSITLIKQERERLASGLAGIEGIQVWPSQANFLLLRVTGPTGANLAPELNRYLAGVGIAIRAYSHPRLRDTIRISVGLPSDTDAVVAAVGRWRRLVVEEA